MTASVIEVFSKAKALVIQTHYYVILITLSLYSDVNVACNTNSHEKKTKKTPGVRKAIAEAGRVWRAVHVLTG